VVATASIWEKDNENPACMRRDSRVGASATFWLHIRGRINSARTIFSEKLGFVDNKEHKVTQKWIDNLLNGFLCVLCELRGKN